MPAMKSQRWPLRKSSARVISSAPKWSAGSTGSGSGMCSRGASTQTAASATITIATAAPPTRIALDRARNLIGLLR